MVDETGVDLDEGGTGVEFGDGVGFVHDAADPDDWHGAVEGGAETGDDVGGAGGERGSAETAGLEGGGRVFDGLP